MGFSLFSTRLQNFRLKHDKKSVMDPCFKISIILSNNQSFETDRNLLEGFIFRTKLNILLIDAWLFVYTVFPNVSLFQNPELSRTAISSPAQGFFNLEVFVILSC